MTLRSLLSFVVAGLALADRAPSQFTIELETEIDGDQAGNACPVDGFGDFTLDFLSQTLDYDVGASNLSSPVTAWVLRGPAPPGAAGPVVLDLGVATVGQGQVQIPPDQLGNLASGYLYVEIQTTNKPGGEGRGQITPKPIPYCFCDATVAPCANEDPTAGCTNSTGKGATIATRGLTSLSIDSLVFEACDLPPNKAEVFFGGPNPLDPALPFGDGHLCIAPPLKRLMPVFSDATGYVEHGPGILSTLNVNPGDVWCFQVWFRDPSGPCGKFYNLSHAIQVAFTE